MPKIATSKNLIVSAGGARSFNIDASPEGVAFAIEAEGVRHVASFSIEETIAFAVTMIRLAERASLAAEEPAALIRLCGLTQ